MLLAQKAVSQSALVSINYVDLIVSVVNISKRKYLVYLPRLARGGGVITQLASLNWVYNMIVKLY